jgi:hypothetical protein
VVNPPLLFAGCLWGCERGLALLGFGRGHFFFIARPSFLTDGTLNDLPGRLARNHKQFNEKRLNGSTLELQHGTSKRIKNVHIQ